MGFGFGAGGGGALGLLAVGGGTAGFVVVGGGTEKRCGGFGFGLGALSGDAGGVGSLSSTESPHALSSEAVDSTLVREPVCCTHTQETKQSKSQAHE